VELAFLVPADLAGPSGGNTYNTELARELAAAGACVETVGVPGNWPSLDQRQGQAVAAAMAGRDAVLIDGLMASCAPEAIRSAAAHGMRVFVLVHMPVPAETGLDPALERAYAASERQALRAAAGVICPSRWAGRDLRRRYGLQSIGVALPGTHPAPAAGGSAPPRLLTVAALRPGKNHRALLEALEQLDDLQWTARWVGPDGPGDGYAASLRQAVARSPVAGRIGFTGPLAGPALEAQWQRADLLVFPSLWETYGLVVAEALARGVPAVVGAATGAVEALAGASAPESALPGTAVDPRDPDALAAVLRCWLTDGPLRSRWEARALQRRQAGRTWADTATDVLGIIGT
jgi:glycosyltransferase involved in cell wall biosynthesis